MSNKKIQDLPLKTPLDAMKIPTGGFGDYAVTVKTVLDYFLDKYNIVQEDEIKALELLIQTKLDTKANKDNVYTKDETDGLIALVNGELSEEIVKNLALLENLDGELQGKANLSDVYLKTETYSQQEVNVGLDSKIESVNGKTGKSITLSRDDVSVPTDAQIKAFEKEDQYVITESGRTQREKNKDIVSALDFGVKNDGVTDTTTAMQSAISYALQHRKKLHVPSGVYYITGTLELGGLDIEGVYAGFLNVSGTIFKGNGTNTMFQQSVSTFETHGSCFMRGLRIENVKTGIDFGFLNRAEFKDIYISNQDGPAIQFGRHTNSGPQWNTMTNVRTDTYRSPTLVMNGSNWCNNNTFLNCFFESRELYDDASIKIECFAGWGALDNVFISTEVASSSYGYKFDNAHGTQLIGGYFECYGPSIWIGAGAYSSRGTVLSGGIFARLSSNLEKNPTGKNAYIYYEGDVGAEIIINAGRATFSGEDQKDCCVIGYNSSGALSNLQLNILNEISIVQVSTSGISQIQSGLLRYVTKKNYGSVTSVNDYQPTMGLSYVDGSNKFQFRRNGIRNSDGTITTDVGVIAEINNTASFQVENKGRVLFKQEVGFKLEENTSIGNKTHRIPAYNSDGQFIGYIPVYSS